MVSCQVEEDLDRATCLITDGDVASLLPSKTHGNLSCFKLDLALGFCRLLFFPRGRSLYFISNVLYFCSVCRRFSEDVLGPSEFAGNKKGGAAQGEGGIQ